MKLFGIKFWTWKQRRTYIELSKLDNRILKDMGINRCEIKHIVNSMGD